MWLTQFLIHSGIRFPLTAPSPIRQNLAAIPLPGRGRQIRQHENVSRRDGCGRATLGPWMGKPRIWAAHPGSLVQDASPLSGNIMLTPSNAGVPVRHQTAVYC